MVMDSKQPHTALLEEKKALSAYFESLLWEEEAQKRKVAATPKTEPVVATEQQVAAAPSPIPKWGEGRFQAMLFKVAGLTLAVPLVELNGVQEATIDDLTPMPGHVDWYLGLQTYRNKRIPVIDTALFVMPDNRKVFAKETQHERLRRIVFINEATWGLACDEVAQVITLSTDDVRWRTNKTSRQWLAGTVIKQMCAIIDPPAFAEMLRQGMEQQMLIKPELKKSTKSARK